MLDFYLIKEEQPKPDYPEQVDLDFVGGIDYKTYERLINKDIIDNRFDYYSDFRWNVQMINQIMDKKGEQQDPDFEKLNNILRKAIESNSGLIAYCD